MAVDPRHNMTYEEFLDLPDDGIRRELIDGEVFVTVVPNLRHQEIVGEIYCLISNHLHMNGGGHVYVARLEVLLPGRQSVQPDVIFVSDSSLGILGKPRIEGAPTLLVEVLSDQARDRVIKRDLYERSGVAEYWIVDPVMELAEIYRLAEGGYGEPAVLGKEGKLSTPAIPGLTIDLAELFSL